MRYSLFPAFLFMALLFSCAEESPQSTPGDQRLSDQGPGWSSVSQPEEDSPYYIIYEQGNRQSRLNLDSVEHVGTSLYLAGDSSYLMWSGMNPHTGQEFSFVFFDSAYQDTLIPGMYEVRPFESDIAQTAVITISDGTDGAILCEGEVSVEVNEAGYIKGSWRGEYCPIEGAFTGPAGPFSGSFILKSDQIFP